MKSKTRRYFTQSDKTLILIDKKAVTVVTHGERKMIGNRFVKVEPHRKTKCGR